VRRISLGVACLAFAVFGVVVDSEPGSPAAAGHAASASVRSCGTFDPRSPYLLPEIRVRVRVLRGTARCIDARHVMKVLFRRGPRRRVFGWSCIGPQTGYAKCRKAGRGVIDGAFVG
jgi:hypothetical protein